MAKQKRFYKTLPYHGINIRVWVTDGEDVVHVELDEMDILLGDKMDPEGCVASLSCMRHKGDGTFPHPVLASWVTKSMVFILTSANAKTGKYRGKRYRHVMGDHIRVFDRTGKWTGPKTVPLYPPGKSHGIGGDTTRKFRGGAPGGKRGKPTGRVSEPKGINGRFFTVKMWEKRMAAASA